MSKKWGNVAKAIGQGVLQMGMLDQRQKMEAERAANLERIRTENRQNKLDDVKSGREYQAGVLQKQNEYQSGVREKQNEHKDKVRLDQNKLADQRSKTKMLNDNEQKSLDRKSRESQAALKSGKDGTRFARDEIVRLDKQIGSIGNQIAKIRADQDTFYEPGEKKAIIKSLTDKADKYDKQISFITNENPELNKIFGKESMTQEKVNKAKAAAANLSKNSSRMNNAFSTAKGIASAKSNKPVEKQQVKLGNVKKSRKFNYMTATPKERKAFSKNIQLKKDLDKAEAKEFLNGKWKSLSSRERRFWLINNKKLIDRNLYDKLMQQFS